MSATPPDLPDEIRLGLGSRPGGVTVPNDAVLALIEALRGPKKRDARQTGEEIDPDEADMLADHLEIALSTHARGFFMDEGDALTLGWAARRLREQHGEEPEWAVNLAELLGGIER